MAEISPVSITTASSENSGMQTRLSLPPAGQGNSLRNPISGDMASSHTLSLKGWKAKGWKMRAPTWKTSRSR
ncbi:hypothetical protein MBAV_005202 [Candidatus Magnetobacterium bavaricum]|uniref:Uncharacterized protein n=1 Tax=Candidatus Magnetobacterium bavaricum TaxID=29290 RepID=A0A0F3GL08_9BACT|nr:hypothetical protein MBAV_005202 [Candidatus Magnetobacterium bavaricum]